MPPLSVEALVSLLISLRPILLWGLQALPELSEFLIMGLERTRFFSIVCQQTILRSLNVMIHKRTKGQKGKRAKGQSIESNSKSDDPMKNESLHFKIT